VKLRNVAISILIVFALAAVLCLVPLRELDGESAVSLLGYRIITPTEPKTTVVLLPDDVLQFMDETRSWVSKWWDDFLDNPNSTFDDLSDQTAPKDLRDKAYEILNNPSTCPEIMLYMVWWFQNYEQPEFTEQFLTPYISPEFLNKLTDRPHLLLLALVISREQLRYALSEGEEPAFSRDFMETLHQAHAEILARASRIAPRDAFSRLIAIQAAYQAVVSERGADIWLKATDAERQQYSKQALPYLKRFLRSKRGWLVREPTWFSYIRSLDSLEGPARQPASRYALLSSEPLSTFGMIDAMVAADASERGDWGTVLLTVDAVDHLSDLYPEDEDKDQGYAFFLVFTSISAAQASPDLKQELAEIHEEWIGPLIEALELTINAMDEPGAVVKQDSGAVVSEEPTDEEQLQKIRERVSRLRKALEKEVKAPATRTD
jgi:hypothetical protein